MSAPDLARLVEHAAARLHAVEGRHPVHFHLRLGEHRFDCIARLVLLLDQPGFRVIVEDACTRRRLCESRAGRCYDIDVLGDDEFEHLASASRGEAQASVLVPPAYMAHLVDRGANRLRALGWRRPVSFNWWSEGKSYAYTARIDWSPNEMDPRVVIFDDRSSYLVCRSLPGRLHEIDPYSWCIDPAPDELYEFEQEQLHASAQSSTARARRSGR